MAVEVERVEWADLRAVGLRRQMYEDLSALYPAETRTVEAAGGFDWLDRRAAASVVDTVVGLLDGAPVGCASLRLLTPGGGRGPLSGVARPTGELAKVFVAPPARRLGLASALLDRLHAAARARGLAAVVLETGTAQPGAAALYRRLGYRAIPVYPPYDDDGSSCCFALDLTPDAG